MKPWEEDYGTQEVEAEAPSKESGLPWEQDYYSEGSDYEYSDYAGAAYAEGNDWDNFFHAFSKARNFTESAGDYMEGLIPLGRIQITDPETGDLAIKYVPPSDQLREAVKSGDEDYIAAVINGEREARLQQRFSHLYTDEGLQKEGTDDMIGTFLGYMADPTTLIPFAAGWKGAMASGSAIGGADMAMFNLAEEGRIDMGDVALGMTAGAVVPVVLKGAGKVVGKHEWQDSVSAARTMLNRYEKNVLKNVKQGIDLDMAQVKAASQAGFTDGLAGVVKASEKAGRLPTVHRGMTPAMARDSLEQFELTASEKFLNKYGFLKTAAEKMDEYVGSMSTRLKKKDYKLFNAVRKADLDTHVATNNRIEQVDKWTRMVKVLEKTSKPVYDELSKALFSRNFKSVWRIFRELEKSNPEFKGMADEFRQVRKVLTEMGEDAVGAGYKLKLDPLYFPRVVRNAQALGVQRKSVLAKALTKAEKAQGRKLSANERRQIIERHIEAQPRPGQKEAGHVKKRKRKEVGDDELPHYAGINDALVSYIQAMTHSIERRKFLRKYGGRKAQKRTNDVAGRDLTKSIGDLIDSRRKHMGWTPAEENQVLNLLQARFGPGEMSSTRFWSEFKNYSYGLTLGNFISAMTQLGDNAFGMFINGFKPHVRAMSQALRLPGKESNRLVEKTAIGLSEINDEIIHDTTRSKKFLDTVLKWSGFSSIDKFGKENLINGSLLKAKKLAQTEKGRREFVAKWGGAFGGDTLPLLKKLQNFKKGDELDDNMRLFLWHNLSDAQPIGLSEMPAKYLNHPNGRVFYMLKTFTIKQFDLMRREIWDLAKNGQTSEAAKKLAMFSTLFVAINGGADELKNAVRGKDFDINDAAVNNLAKLVGMSRYQISQFGKDGPMSTIAKMILPPFPVDSVYKGITEGKPDKIISAIPITGRATERFTKE